ncbi:MAG: A/G-specific adenine glycosylase, partial [Cruoricaptor ignavus]|nr:A/G-specific adenine glycosylase [Cruoricaptor ignavus]
MKHNKQNPDFLHIGKKLLDWYEINARELAWRTTTNPYKIWICEIILQQTQVKQGTAHYLEFIKRFPDAKSLANAETDEVLLYWKGLGYYSRALNLHKAAKQIMED